MVSRVVTGGYWEEADTSGVYRVTVIDDGWEHVSSRVHLQWIQEDGVGKIREILASVALKEINGRGWSVGMPDIEKVKGKFIIELRATHSHSLEERLFTIRPKSMGKYDLSIKVLKKGRF